MMEKKKKYSQKTEYKYVYYIKAHKHSSELSKPFKSQIGRCAKMFKNIKDAAKWVDVKLIEEGKAPLNILTPKKEND